MAVNTQNVQLGVCDVTFNGMDLGATKGGVTVEIKTTTFEAKVDQYGETPIKEIITGTQVTVKVPMAETNLVTLQAVMPQSTISTSAAAPTGGWVINKVGGYAIGATAVVLTPGAGTPKVGGLFTFSGHASIYKITSWTPGTNTLSFAAQFDGKSGLQAAVAQAEALTFQAVGTGVTLTSGVNTDLLASAALLKLHPSGAPIGQTDNDFTVYLAAPSPNFTFKYEFGAEKIYEVTFKGFPDTLNNSRIAAFGVA